MGLDLAINLVFLAVLLLFAFTGHHLQALAWGGGYLGGTVMTWLRQRRNH